MLRQIKQSTPGTARRKHLELDYYAWVQNGRPTFGEPKGKFRDGRGGKEELYEHDKHKSDQTAARDVRGELTKRLKKMVQVVRQI